MKLVDLPFWSCWYTMANRQLLSVLSLEIRRLSARKDRPMLSVIYAGHTGVMQ